MNTSSNTGYADKVNESFAAGSFADTDKTLRFAIILIDQSCYLITIKRGLT